jgi:hypothetical protein
MLWVAVGEGQTFEGTDWYTWVGDDFNGPMSLDFLGGKILRLDPETGNGLADNPFYNGNPASARSKVWANGLRQPFRCDFIPGPLEPQILCGQVGWYTVESVLWLTRGSNAGWPCWEGGQHAPDKNPGTVACQDYYNGRTEFKPYSPEVAPYNYFHNGQSAASIGGVFLPADKWPKPFGDSFLFADFPSSQVMSLAWDVPMGRAVGWATKDQTPIQPVTFLSNADQPVRFRLAEDGSVLYIGHCVSCSRFGVLRRVWFNGTVGPTKEEKVKEQLEIQGLILPVIVVDKVKNATADGVALNATDTNVCTPNSHVDKPLPKTWDSVMYVGQFVNSIFARNDVGPIELDASVGGAEANDGSGITMGGVRFSKGVGMANGVVHVGLNGHCYRFKSFVGVGTFQVKKTNEKRRCEWKGCRGRVHH